MSEDSCRRRLDAAEFAVLATIGPDGSPHAVPVVFALDGDHVLIPVDTVKDKRTTRLRRFANLERDPRAALLADGRSSDWSRLWWVRADLRLVDTSGSAGSDRLAARYGQYREPGAIESVVRLRVERWTGWAADEESDAVIDGDR